MHESRTYQLGSYDVKHLNESLDQIWLEYSQAEWVNKRVGELGITPQEFWCHPREAVFPLSQPDPGFAEAGLVVLVFFAPAINDVVAHVAKTLWDEFVLPRLQNQLGRGALPEKTNRTQAPS